MEKTWLLNKAIWSQNEEDMKKKKDLGKMGSKPALSVNSKNQHCRSTVKNETTMVVSSRVDWHFSSLSWDCKFKPYF